MLIEDHVADAIVAACDTIAIDPAALAEEAAHAGTLAIPLVARLRAAVPPDAAAAVHRGATSQDVVDCVLMRQAVAGSGTLGQDLDRILAALGGHAVRHAATPAMGRTLLQDALPVAFGLRIAQWHAGIAEATARLVVEVRQARVQYGGPVGTRAGLDGHGAAITTTLADALGLRASAPWHARRGGVAGIGTALAIVIGALGKMARDVALLAQTAVGEAREPEAAGRGGSSAMPHKRNPTGCQVALSAAGRAPGLAASLLAGLPQEQERGLGGWQAEAPVIAELFLLAAGAAEAMATVAEGLEIDEDAVARNVAGAGADLGESASIIAALLDGDSRI